MKGNIGFDLKSSTRITEKEIEKEGKKLNTEIIKIRKKIKHGYGTDYASLNLPKDKKLLRDVKRLARKKLKLDPKIIVVVGIGGSNLGTKAIHEAVNGRLYNHEKNFPKVFFADTVDTDKAWEILDITKSALKRKQKVLVNVVTKSGKTTETIALFEVFLRQLKRKFGADYKKYVVVTTDKDSLLWTLAKNQGYDVLEVPKKVGGRYSVFSAVSLFPLKMLGLKIGKLHGAAQDMLKKCIRTNIRLNPAAVSALTLYLQFKKGKNINDNFIFSTDLEAVGKWYRQLMGESIGKKMSLNGKRKVNSGITPTVSIGSTDLHSMAQLYLGGPDDKLTTFIKVRSNKKKIRLPNYRNFEQLVDNIQGRPLSDLMDAIYEGVKTAYDNNSRPFMEIMLKDKREESIAALMQFKMVEMMYLGYLLDVNPFDQPRVEDYKQETRRILNK